MEASNFPALVHSIKEAYDLKALIAGAEEEQERIAKATETISPEQKARQEAEVELTKKREEDALKAKFGVAKPPKRTGTEIQRRWDARKRHRKLGTGEAPSSVRPKPQIGPTGRVVPSHEIELANALETYHTGKLHHQISDLPVAIVNATVAHGNADPAATKHRVLPIGGKPTVACATPWCNNAATHVVSNIGELQFGPAKNAGFNTFVSRLKPTTLEGKEGKKKTVLDPLSVRTAIEARLKTKLALPDEPHIDMREKQKSLDRGEGSAGEALHTYNSNYDAAAAEVTPEHWNKYDSETTPLKEVISLGDGAKFSCSDGKCLTRHGVNPMKALEAGREIAVAKNRRLAVPEMHSTRSDEGHPIYNVTERTPEGKLIRGFSAGTPQTREDRFGNPVTTMSLPEGSTPHQWVVTRNAHPIHSHIPMLEKVRGYLEKRKTQGDKALNPFVSVERKGTAPLSTKVERTRLGQDSVRSRTTSGPAIPPAGPSPKGRRSVSLTRLAREREVTAPPGAGGRVNTASLTPEDRRRLSAMVKQNIDGIISRQVSEAPKPKKP
jgi:hypothetical protein